MKPKEEGRKKDLPDNLTKTTVLLLWQKIIEKVNFECVNKTRNRKGTDGKRKCKCRKSGGKGA